jgi:gamma-glutamylaminecyclotransferase
MYGLLFASEKYMNMRLLFVYGSLMKGYCNHFLLKDAVFVSKARTVEKYIMYCSEFPYVSQTTPLSQIQGEVFEIPNNDSWIELDELEEHPNVYERKYCQVELLSSGRLVSAELYFNEVYPHEGPGIELVPSGSYADTKSSATKRTD